MILGPDFKYADRVLKVKDGDGDGWVYDNTPRKRLATPSEMKAGKTKSGAKVTRATGPRAATRGTSGAASNRPSSAGKGIGPDHPKYKARMSEYDAKIKAAKDEPALIRVVDKVQRDLILNDADYHKVLDAVAAKSEGKDASLAPSRGSGGSTGSKDIDAVPTPQQTPKKSVLSRVKEKLGGKKPDAAADPPAQPKASDPAKGSAKAPSRPDGAVPTTGQADLEAAGLQAKHFSIPSNGIHNADPDGLWNHILQDPRFQVKVNGSGGNATNFWVHDTGTEPPERWMVKSTFFDGVNDAGVCEERINDQMASAIGAAAGLKVSDVRYASAPGEATGMLAQRDWTEMHASGAKVVDHTNLASGSLQVSKRKKGASKDDPESYEFTPEAIEKIKNGPNPTSPLQIVLFDYLINNGMDRHAANVLVVDHGDDGYEVGAIDHGMASGPKKWRPGTGAGTTPSRASSGTTGRPTPTRRTRSGWQG